MKTILILTCDLIGQKMAGPAIRVIEIARILCDEHKIHIGCPEISGDLPDLPDNVTVVPYGASPAWEKLHDYHCIIIPGSMKVDAHIEAPVLIDLYDPYILSNLSRTDKSESVQHQELLILKNNIQRGDFFVCASDRQREFWLGLLAAEGRVNVHQFQADPHLRKLIDLAPFGISREQPCSAEWVFPGDPEAFKLVWAGGIWDWFDPLTLIQAVNVLNQRGTAISLFFMGTQHPNPKMTQMSMVDRARKLAQELSLLDTSIFFGDWIPYQERGAVLCAADAGVSTHYPHLETHFSFRTRILDYIWAHKPYICTLGDAFADLALQRDIGNVVEPENVDSLVDAIYALVSDRTRYKKCVTNLAMVANELRWENVLKPIVLFCKNPHRAVDFSRASVSGEDDAVLCGGCEASHVSAGEILSQGIQQTISVQQMGICKLEVKLATFDRLNSGIMSLKLFTSKNDLLVSIPFDVRTVVDNHWKTFCFGPLPALPDQKLVLKLIHHGATSGNAITVWVDDKVTDTEYILNGVKHIGSINYRVYSMVYSASDSKWISKLSPDTPVRKVARWLKRT